MQAAPQPVHTVVLDLTLSFDLDIGGINELDALRRELQRTGIRLVLTGIGPKVRDRLERSGLADDIGPANIHAFTRDAMADIDGRAGARVEPTKTDAAREATFAAYST